MIFQSDAEGLDFKHKAFFIRSDPVTCARYFDRRFLKCFKSGIFGEYPLSYHYWRIEFQHRGSPHVHGMYWLEGAPVLDTVRFSNIEHVSSFIDRFVTTDGDDRELSEYINYQKHKHRPYCKRVIRGQTVCRFKFPHLPLPHTEVLLPLGDDVSESDRAQHQVLYNRIVQFCNNAINDEIDRVFNGLSF